MAKDIQKGVNSDLKKLKFKEDATLDRVVWVNVAMMANIQFLYQGKKTIEINYLWNISDTTCQNSL